MEKSQIPQTRERLNLFAAQQWDKTLNFLQGKFSLPRVDCEDIFQESFIILYQNIIDGKLDGVTASLSTYFNSICRNKAYELIRKRGRTLLIVDEFPDSTKNEFNSEIVEHILSRDESSDQLEQRKSALVREIVKKLPEPCDKILWGFYRDGFSLRTMAEMLKYKNEDTVKATKYRCGEKFKTRFLEIAHTLFD